MVHKLLSVVVVLLMGVIAHLGKVSKFNDEGGKLFAAYSLRTKAEMLAEIQRLEQKLQVKQEDSFLRKLAGVTQEASAPLEEHLKSGPPSLWQGLMYVVKKD